MSEVQKTVVPPTGDLSRSAVVPTPYLSVFMVPFQPLAFLDQATSFWLWTARNRAAYIFSLRFLTQETTKARPEAGTEKTQKAPRCNAPTPGPRGDQPCA